MPDLDPFFFKINSWSFTKHRVWNRCQRQYDFEYIAPYVKSAPVVNPEKIRWLRNFTSKFVVQGQLIHDIIDKQIQFHCENKPMDLNEAMDAFSKKVSLYKNIGGETFTEYHNGEKITDSFFAAIDENGKTCLQTFFGKWPGYQNRECLRHEEFDHFNIGDTRGNGQSGFCRENAGRYARSHGLEDRAGTMTNTRRNSRWRRMCSGQRSITRMSADEISTELVFLKTGATKPYAFFEEQLREVQEMIPREFVAMNASYEYGDFPARPSQRECLSCKFAEVCPDTAIKRT